MAVETIAKYLPHQLAAQRVQEVVFEVCSLGAVCVL